MFAFGSKDVPAAEVEFLDEMLAGTKFDVLAEFFPNFTQLDKFEHLAAFDGVPTTIVCGTKDKLTSIGHSRKMAEQLPNATLVECDGRRAHGDLRGARAGQRGARGPRGVGHAMTEVLTVDGSRAADVLAVIHESFANRPPLDPPATALDETVESVARGARRARRAAGRARGRAGRAPCSSSRAGGCSGCAGSACSTRVRGLGVAAQMASQAEEIAAARKFGGLEIEARVELPKTVEFWRRLGYVESGRNGNRLNMLKMLPITRVLHTAEDTRAFGEWLATLLRHGDLVILTGDLGAGKTTLTQGIGAGTRRPRRRHLADLRDLARAPVARRRPAADPRRRLPARRRRRARRPRPRHRRRSTPSRWWSGARVWPRRSRSTASSSG